MTNARLAPLTVLTAIAAAAASGCGQAVETCGAACALPGATTPFSYCTSACGASQTAAEADGRGANFQAMLTCIGDVGSFSSFCAPLACGLTDAFGTPPGCGAGDGGSVGPGDGSLIDAVSGAPDVGVVVTVDASVAGDASGDGGLAACYQNCDSNCVGDTACISNCETSCQSR